MTPFKLAWFILTFFSTWFLLFVACLYMAPNAEPLGVRLLALSSVPVAGAITRKLFTGKLFTGETK